MTTRESERGQTGKAERWVSAILLAMGLLLAAGRTAAQDSTRPQHQPVLQAVNTGGLETRSAALILSGQEGGELSLSVLAIPVPLPSQPTRVALIIDIAGAALLAGHGDQALRVEVYAYALQAANAVSGFLTQAFEVEPHAIGDDLRRGGVKFLAHLDLLPGPYSMRVLVHQRRTGRFGLRVLPLDVPSWSTGEESLIPPLFLEPADQWLLVREETVLSDRPTMAFPMLLEGRQRVPATRPVLPSHGRAKVYLAGAPVPGELEARLVGPESGSMQKVDLGVVRPVPADLAGLDLMAADIELGALLPGQYGLEILPAGGQPNPARTTPLLVLAAGIDLEIPTWAQLTQSDGDVFSAESSARSSAPDGILPTPTTSEIVPNYLLALEQLAAEDRTAAWATVMELQTSGVVGTPGSQARLETELLKMAAELASRRVEALVPLIWLHEDLYREHHQSGRYMLASHCRRMMVQLVEQYAARSRTPQASTLAAAALVSLAGYVQEVGSTAAAQKAFELALDYDDSNPAALLGLAVIQEAYGQYGRAVRLLERLVELQPEDAEARLRLAVNLRRLESGRRAEALLRHCLGEGLPEWITAVAYQELAELLVEDGRQQAAVALLQQGLEVLPRNQRLYIQLAAALDGMERPAEAHEVLARLDPRRGRESSSARLRYAQWPLQPVEDARNYLSRAAGERLPALGDSLAELVSAQR